MRAIFFRFSCATLFVLCTVSANAADEVSPVPKRFKASIGGFMGSSYRIELGADGTLDYTALKREREGAPSVKITPTPADWREFRAALETIGVWKWQARYANHEVMDGTQWGIEIAFGDRAMKSEGSNSYPDAVGKPNGRPETTPTFDRYLAAVRKLLGGRNFE